MLFFKVCFEEVFEAYALSAGGGISNAQLTHKLYRPALRAA